MICVDYEQACIPNRRWRCSTVAHLSCAPRGDLAPLHAFADALGLRREWFQPSGAGCVPHYDLTPDKRAAAVQRGALELLNRSAVVAHIRAWRSFAAVTAAEQLNLPDLLS
jgi:hypothetical protein